MKKQLKVLLFVVALLTLVMMTMICVSAAGDMEQTDAHNFKVENADGSLVGYYTDLGSLDSTTAGGAWADVPEGGKLVLLKTVNYADKTTIWLYNSNSFTVDGAGMGLTGKPNLKISNALGVTTATNTIKFYNISIQSGTSALEFYGAGTTYQFEKVALNISGYGLYQQAIGATYDFLGTENNFKTTSNAFYIGKASTLNFYGGRYENTGKQATIYIVSPDDVADGFDAVLNIYGGEFIHSGTGTGDYYNAVIAVYNTAGQKQINIHGGTFTSAGRFVIVKLASDTLDLNIYGGTFNATHANAEAIVRFLNNGTEVAPITMGGKLMTSSIDITGGTFDMANTGMPIIYSYTKTAIGTAACPVEINVSNAKIVKENRLIVVRTGGYFNITVSDVKGAKVKNNKIPFGWIETEASVNVNATFEDCELLAGQYLVNAKGSSTVSVDIYSGSYTLSEGIVVVAEGSSAKAECYIENGTFSVPKVESLYSALVEMTVDAGTFIVQKVDADTVFDDVEDYFEGDAVMQVGIFVTVDDGETYEFASIDDVVEAFGDVVPVLPNYATVAGVTFELDGGSTLVFEGGEYTSFGGYMFHVIDGTIIATDATFTAPNGRIVYITKAAASADMSFTDCTITSGDGLHMFQGSTGSDAIAKFNLTLTDCVTNAGYNVTSFGATDDAKVIINGGTHTAKGMIVYTGTVGQYIFNGGTYTAKTNLINIVPGNAEEGAEYDVVMSDLTFNGQHLGVFSANDCTYNLSVKNVNAFLSGGAFSNDIEKTGKLNVALENVMIVISATKAAYLVSGLADSVSLALAGNVTVVTNVETVVCGDAGDVIGATSPAIKYAGELYRAFFSSEADVEATYENSLYLGEDEEQTGIRFATTLSDDVIALAKAAVDAGKSVAYGTVIAPTDYVISAKAFTKAALDAKFGSVDGVKGEKNIYVDVEAARSLRDADGDGVYEAFSAVLVNLKEVNYNRAFAAVAYVVIDGVTYYSSFNTLDQARSAAEMADALIAAGEYADDTAVLALLNKYAGK